MKAMIMETYGKVPLRLADMPLPEIGEHDVLAEIHAASVNPIDFKIRDGKVKLLLHYKMPLILGNDFFRRCWYLCNSASEIHGRRCGDNNERSRYCTHNIPRRGHHY
jgi:hypothetical protein